MKLFQPFKGILIAALLVLYLSGAAVYLFKGWWQVDRGMGPEPQPLQITSLQAHSVCGLVFLILFGYLWATHVLPGWRRRRRLKTGVTMAAMCLVLFATVPFLFYASHEGLKSSMVWVHTYLGLASLIPFAAHMYSRPD